jgi:hypothetical protein
LPSRSEEHRDKIASQLVFAMSVQNRVVSLSSYWQLSRPSQAELPTDGVSGREILSGRCRYARVSVDGIPKSGSERYLP